MLNPDFLLERSQLKKQTTFWRALFFIFVALIFGFLFIGNKSNINEVSSLSRASIARIKIEGIIFENNERDEILREIAENKNIKAVILEINSPGGSAVGGETLYNEIKNINDKKPVVAVMKSLAASAAYLISLGCERVYAHNGTITGSIGVIAEIPNVKKAADKLGVEFHYVKTSPLKGSPTLFEEKNEAALAVLKNTMEDFYDYFVDVTAKNRKLKKEEVLKLADGRIYSGKKAVEYKLIDELGTEKDALKWLQTKKNIDEDLEVKDISLEKKKPALEELLGAISKNMSKIFDFGTISEKYQFQGLKL